jgi:ABC-type oligopeptide transport system substrate-binding subunit
MKKASRRIVALLALLTMMAAGGACAWAQNAPKSLPSPVTNPELKQLQATAEKAQAKIMASVDETRALYNAVLAKNVEQAKLILLKNGFTEKQLEGVKIVLVNDAHGGGTTMKKIHVKITASCCPLTITITVSF